MTQIKENLTDDEEKLIDKLAKSWIDRALTFQQLDENKMVEGIDFIYSLGELKPPRIVICNDPMDMMVAAQEAGAEVKKGETFDYFGLGYDSGWTAFYDYFQKIGIDLSDLDFNKWMTFLESGIWASLFYENVAFVCAGPSRIHLNKEENLHNEKGMAIEWKSGWGLYFLNGVGVEEELVLTPAEKLDPVILLKEKNAEVRREMVRKIGIERICQKLDAKVIDKEGDYELLLLDLQDGRQRPYLKMKNPSIDTIHIEGVAPDIKTVRDALAWRNQRVDLPRVLT